MTVTSQCNDYNDEQSGSKTEVEKAERTTYQLPTKVIRTKTENQVTSKEIYPLKIKKIRAKSIQVQKEKKISGAGNQLKNRRLGRKNVKDRLKRCSSKPPKKAVILLYIAAFVQNAKCSIYTATAEVDTFPIIFGASVILKCKCMTDTSSNIHWLKGPNKNYLTDGNSSLRPAEYSTRLYQEREEYLYLLIIHKFSLANVGLYICEFGFFKDELTLSLNENMTYVPVDDDISIQISDTRVSESSTVDIHVQVNNVYPKPNCTVFYKDVEISNTVNISVNNTSKLYKVQINVMSVDCYGVFYIDCSVSSSHFNKSEVIDRCCSGDNIQIEIIVVISTIVGLAALTFIVILGIRLLRRRSKGMPKQTSKQSPSSYSLVPK